MDKGVKQYSLRLHLLGLISIPVIFAGMLIGGISMLFAYHEISEVYDAQLSHAAKVLLQLTEHEVREHDGYEIELGPERKDISHRYEKNISFRIWKGEHRVTESVNAEGFSDIHAPPGFSDQNIGGELWRFFVFVDGSGDITVEVAERYSIRTELILQILGSFIIPALLFFPVLLLLTWYGTTRSLRPLVSVSHAVDRRDANDLDPIEPPRVPKEIMPLIRALNRLLYRLGTSLRREREFTDNAAHELRTPLAAMKTQTQVLMKKAGDMPECREGLDNLHASIDRAAHMVEQLLSFARLQSHDLAFEMVDFSGLLDEGVKDFAAIAANKNVALEAAIAPRVFIRGNRDALWIMLRNLIDNAVKFTPAGGNVIVRLQGNARLTVADSGPGIPDAEKEKVLERFSRGTKVKTEGSGLGLSMVKWACDLHGARLAFSDNAPAGLVVTIELEAI